MNSNDLGSFNSGILGRLFLGQASGIFMAFNYFPSIFEPIGFTSISKLFSEIFNVEYSERAARMLMFGFNPSGVENATAGVMNWFTSALSLKPERLDSFSCFLIARPPENLSAASRFGALQITPAITINASAQIQTSILLFSRSLTAFRLRPPKPAHSSR